MRLRNVVLAFAAIAAGIALLRRRLPSGYVEVHFDDGSTIRLTSGREARDLLDDVDAVLDTVA